MTCIREAFDALPGPTGIVVGADWAYANPALKALVGHDPAGTAAVEVVIPTERAAVRHHYEGRTGLHSTQWLREGAAAVAVEVSVSPLVFEGRPAVVIAATDLSAREVLFTRLDQSEESFRALVDASPDAMFVHGEADDDYELLWANPAMVRLLGFDRASDLVGRQSIDSFVHPDDREALDRYRREVRTGAPPGMLDVRWVARDGRVHYMRGTRRGVRFADHPAVLVIARDHTEEISRERERREAEASTRESELRYRLLFDGSPLPICMFDAQTLRYVAVNEKMVDVYGYSREEFMAMTVKDVKLIEDVPSMVASISASAIGTQTHVGVVKHRRKDGTVIDIDITAHQVLVSGRHHSLAIGVDVTERRRVEEQLRQSQKMDAIGQLAGGVAHDFNNILAVILATTSFLRDDLGEHHALSRDVADIESAAQRAAALTRQLLAFSRRQPQMPKLLALRSVVEDVEKMLRRIVGEDIELSTCFAATATVEADAGQLEQVVMNLVINARDAMPRGGRLSIETSNVELDEITAACIGLAPGRYARLSVSDTGCGMDEATKRRLFEPFFTTKEVGRGTGLGLATVFGIVKQSRGGISVHSELGRGSTFSIYLPSVGRGTAASDTATARTSPARGTEMILVVEDDSQLRAVIGRQLRSLGYRTIEAHDAPSACAALTTASEPVDLVLTDLVMPGADGRALAARLIGDHPDLELVFMSGYSAHGAVKTAALGPDEHFIAKPFTVDDLSIAIRRALEGHVRVTR